METSLGSEISTAKLGQWTADALISKADYESVHVSDFGKKSARISHKGVQDAIQELGMFFESRTDKFFFLLFSGWRYSSEYFTPMPDIRIPEPPSIYICRVGFRPFSRIKAVGLRENLFNGEGDVLMTRWYQLSEGEKDFLICLCLKKSRSQLFDL